MKIKLGSIITEISGKVGGQYLQAGPFGHSIRTNPKTTPEAKVNASYVRGMWRRSVSTWKTLTAAQRASWHLFNWNGYTGFPAYVHFNATALYQGHALLISAPAVPVIPIAKDIFVEAFSPTHSMTVTIDIDNFIAGYEVLVRISRVYNLSQRPISPVLRQYYSAGLTSPFITTLAGNYSSFTHQFPNAQQHFYCKFDLYQTFTGFSAPLIGAWLPS